MKSKKEISASSSSNELEKELAEITSELKRKNRDLEVEASLERVRAVAMGMARPDELQGICEILFTELEKLGFNEIRNSQIFIYNDHKGSFTNYGFSEYEGAAIAEIFYNSHPTVNAFITAVRKTNDAFAELSITGDELKAWRNYRIQNGEPDDPRLANINTLYYYFYSIGVGAIGISNFEPISAEQLEILKRFRNVFDFAYRRYTDVSQAENQAREAQIELGLERVRARAMAMQSSGELADLVTTLFNELAKLDFALSWCMINIIDGPSLSNTVWAKNADAGGAPESFHMKFEGYPFHDAMWREWKERNAKYVYTIEGEEKRIYDEYLFNQTEFSRLPETVKAGMRATEKYVASFSFSNFGGLQTVGDAPLPDASLDILSRFGKVFDLTYTRFNDLKQAEEQAREAQIELALERVRARTMAMQHSDELVDAAAILFKQVKDLSVEVWTCGFQIWKPGEPGTTVAYMTLPDGTIRVPFDIPHPPEPFLNRAYQAAQRGDQFYVEEIGGEALATHYKYMLALPGSSDRMVDISAGGFHLPEFQVNHNAYFSQGALLFITYKPVPQSWDIFKRFAKVFEQTYTRFLDLKKAEAQAREALIEGALERVRSRAMAMHKTDELRDAAELLTKELTGLGIESITVCYVLVNEKDKTGAYYGVNPIDGKIPAQPTIMPHTETKVMRALRASWLKQEPVHFIALDPKASIAHQTYIGKLIAAAFAAQGVAPGFTVEGFLSLSPERVRIYSLNFKQGYLFLVGGAPLPAADVDILIRFTKVFELTYTRFLDLKQAEEQAREAKIEAALERVRSRTMAMQHSSELAETVSVLFAQLLGLGITPYQIRTCGIVTFDAEEPIGETWITETNGDINPVAFKSRYDEAPAYKKIYTAWKKGEKFEVLHLQGEKLTEHLGYVVKYAPVHIRDIDAPELPTEIWQHVLFFSQGYLFVITREPLPEYHDVFKRFGAVLQQSYTRFLDLQKAEAQAREALIEGALERVRSRAMAMHKTNELGDAAELLYKELIGLGIDSLSVCYVLVNEQDKTGAYYGINPVDGKMMSIPMIAPHTETKEMRALWASWLKQEPVCFIALDPEASVVHQTYIGKLMASTFAAQGVAPEFTVEGFLLVSPERVNIYSLNFKQGYLFLVGGAPLAAADIDILIRFTKVFELTYTRFLDLKKAEAQAREAQIELSLERVRASAMAMHHSDELSQVLSILFEQFDVLDIRPVDAHLDLFDLEKNTFSYRATGKEGTRVIAEQIVDLDSRPEWQSLAQRWKQGKPQTVDFSYYPKEVIKDLMAFFPDIWAAMPAGSIMNPVVDFPDGIYDVLGYCKFGYLGFHHNRKTTEEENRILIRFTNEFERLYQRFLDLQKAEAQTRESKIELALERVRARTMAMQHSDELAETAYILFQQFRELGENPDQATIGIINEAEGVIEYWVTIYGNQTNKVFKFPIDEPNVTRKIYDAWKAQEKSLVIDLSGQALYDFSKFRESMGGAGYNEAEQRRIINVAFFSKGLINVQSTVTRSAESLRLLERFANVFEGTYTRFLDLKKAEAQAREGQIELALERVRARAMAMRDSKELSEMVSTVFGELTKLDFSLTRCAIVIADSESRGRMIWMANSEAGQPPSSFYRKSLDHPYPNAATEEWKKRTPKWVYHLKGAEKKGMDDYYANSGEVAHMPDEIRQAMGMPESIILSHSFNNFGYLRADSLEYLSEANLDILYRFAKVFDLGYTRFTDIKQAEAQAREAQIELALERVRAKTMAMQHSDELLETSQVVFQQLRDLGETADQISIAIVKEDDGIFDLFATIYGTQMVRVVHPKIDDHFIMGRVYKNWKAHKKSFVVELGGEELRQYNILRNQLGGQNYYNENIGADDRWTVSCASFSRGILSFSSSTEPTKETALLLERFAKVFEQTYTRFIDLQRAEAQTREAQIQLALERVRARTMAMQHSEELKEVVLALYEQLQQLDFDASACNIITNDQKSRTMQYWVSGFSQEIYPVSYSVPYLNHPYHEALLKPWFQGDQYSVIEYSGKTKKSFDKIFFTQTDFKNVPEAPKKTMIGIPSVTFSTAYVGNVAVQALGPVPLSDENAAVLRRFAIVFEQTYTRFLDLKKAEAQAREAQIQLALERVRARTMAMQQSTELAETVSLVSQQLHDLGLSFSRVGFYIWQKDTGLVEGWTSNGTFDGLLPPLLLPFMEDYGHRGIYEAAQRGEHSYEQVLGGDELKRHYEWLLSQPSVWGTLSTTGDNAFVPMQIQYKYAGIFKQGYLMLMATEPQPGAGDLLERFAQVFEQTYTRFLDLKNAEMLARESQIQLALERVRARTMAMQRSNELAEAASVLFQQVKDLGIKAWSTGFEIWEADGSSLTDWVAGPTGSFLPAYKIPLNAYWLFKQLAAAKQRGEEFQEIRLNAQQNQETYAYLSNLPDAKAMGVFDSGLVTGVEFPEVQVNNYVFFPQGSLLFITYEPCPEGHDIFIRFAKVFEQTYTRFLDLQRAEEQAREAEIELGLERVRARTMAMQKSDELQEIIKVVYEQLVHLNILVEHAGFIMDYNTNDDMHIWLADKHYAPTEITIPYFDSPHWNSFIEAKQKGTNFFANYLDFETKNKFYQDLFKLAPGVTDETMAYYMGCPGLAGSTVLMENVGLYIENFAGIPYTDDENSTLMRFGKVFQQTYTRFLDLQKAEDQAREAQIELSLERVRAKTMAMHDSQDVGDTVATMFDELVKLGVDKTTRCGVGIIHNSQQFEVWTASTQTNGEVVLNIGTIDMMIHPLMAALYDEWKAKKDHYTYMLLGEEVKNYYSAVNASNCYKVKFDIDTLPSKQYHKSFIFPEGALYTFSPEPLTQEVSKIATRFASVFGQTYRRYRDLQIAEAQARESQIQLALERVRARTMAMQKSDELAETVSLLFKQLLGLGIRTEQIRTCGIVTFDDKKPMGEQWITETNGEIIPQSFVVSYDEAPAYKAIYKGWKHGEHFMMIYLEGKALKEHLGYLAKGTNVPTRDVVLPQQATEIFNHVMFFSKGCLFIITKEALPEYHDVFKRFGAVFQQSYTRFLDLKKAEDQARKAQIEAAMEKVRSRSLAMQQPAELVEVAQLLRQEMASLGVEELETSSIYIHNDENGKTECWYAIKDDHAENKLVADHMDMTLNETWVGKQMLHFYHSNKTQTSIVMQGANRKQWINYCSERSKLLDGFYGDNIPDRTYHLCKFSGGYMGAASPGEISAESWELLQRAAAVFSFAYTRFSDLQQAQAQAREAVKQASLDRVRGEIASMRTTKDLERIIPLVWNELTILGIPFIRCGVFIVDEAAELIHTHLSTPDGKAIAAFDLPFDAEGIGREVLPAWRKKQMAAIHWSAKEFATNTKNLVSQGAVKSRGKYVTERPDTTLDLHFFPFLQGMLYVGNTEPLNDNEKDLVQSLAEAFSTAYARYEDFNKLEAAKLQVDKTLTDLKAAQTQLIQNEKMASLGELTAGIAHEIQNPLNFVNNFSEVNAELIGEMKEGIEKGDLEEVLALALDIEENSKKINMHGKRADGIVKGMLQHSKSGSAARELTQINALADEYMRLAYHGLRAKDKAFNAEMVTHFDPALPKIMAIGQDIGRVMLNLFNNAFYAVNKKQKTAGTGYKPEITVTTLAVNGQVIVKVKDNGIGIPEAIKEKIMQPFFTTKPTGEGTGLGLSLTYDMVVKGHGGSIQVDSVEGEGSEFIITLPIS